jgi:lysophospholipase L1-like esterase
MAAKPPCLKDPNQVVLIGDSYINWVSHNFPTDLANEAGVTYRNYAQPGYAMASGGLGLIPPEFDQAVADDPNIIAAVMTGGGNDVLIPNTAQYPDGDLCKNDRNSPNIKDCQAIGQRALAVASDLLDRMAKAGVKDIVYFFYPHVPEGTVAGGSYPNEISDYARPKYKALCEGANKQTGGKLNCYFVDLVPVLDNEKGDPILLYFAPTDIHPNPMGSVRMARAVWSVMKEKCIAQPASSGCCAQRGL